MIRSIRRYIHAWVAVLVAALQLAASHAHAEPVLLSAEGQAALAITEPQSSWFGPGGALAVAAHYPLSPIVLIGLRLRAGLLLDGDQPDVAGVDDPGMGSFELASAMLRLRPLAKANDARLGTGLFVDVGAGGGLTGRSARPSVEAGLGYGIGLGALYLAPTLRYLQVIQPDEPPSAEDARLLLAGVELTFHDERPQSKAEIAPLEEPLSLDRDGDGIDDAVDECPDQAEDLDGFEDDDGCPDPDNDADGVADDRDKCPDEAEDRDGFEDDDGCPDPDNDGDGILDQADACPDAAEVINGVSDEDGCPDAGEFELKNGRIVLEERVLFDFQRARVKTRAKPLLKAILALRSQHPEWGAIHIEGHADARGNTQVNQHLSERRANNVMRALIELGVPASALSAAGYGASRLRDYGTTEEAHQRNRRVEFVVETHTRTQPNPPPVAPESPGVRAPTVAPPQPAATVSVDEELSPAPAAPERDEAAEPSEVEEPPSSEPAPPIAPEPASAASDGSASPAVKVQGAAKGSVTGSRLLPQPQQPAAREEAHTP